ncbi:Connectin, partial [Gryllus bimaculatus]
MRARAASLPLLLLLLLLLLAAGSGAAPALNASAEEASAGGGDGGCPAACDCERDARLWAWLPREDGNQLDALGVGQLASLGWAGLRTLDASGNALVRVEGGALRGLARLERLLLARNHLTELPRDLLADAPRLWFLSLAGNPLALPPDGRAFLAAPALQVLDLSACKLSAFPDDVLGEDNSLQELLVANNSIAQVRVHHLARLRRLDASDNRLRQLSADDLAGAPALRSLSLDGNPLGAQVRIGRGGGLWAAL